MSGRPTQASHAQRSSVSQAPRLVRPDDCVAGRYSGRQSRECQSGGHPESSPILHRIESATELLTKQPPVVPAWLMIVPSVGSTCPGNTPPFPFNALISFSRPFLSNANPVTSMLSRDLILLPCFSKNS